MNPHQTTHAVALQDFDTESFCVPFYRVCDLSHVELDNDLKSVAALFPVVVDAKVPANDLSLSAKLLSFGFRKICTQIALRLAVATSASSSSTSNARLGAQLALDEQDIVSHAENFVRDRFSQDGHIPRSAVTRFYARWIRNSTTGRHLVLSIGRNFLTFSRAGDVMRTDLLSVLDQRQGIGQLLVEALIAHARTSGVSSIEVVTECENDISWRLFMRNGFLVQGFQSVFHFVNQGS